MKQAIQHVKSSSTVLGCCFAAFLSQAPTLGLHLPFSFSIKRLAGLVSFLGFSAQLFPVSEQSLLQQGSWWVLLV